MGMFGALEEFVFLSRLGEGSSGQVSRARHIETGKIVAIKKMHFKWGDQGQVRAIREYKALQTLHHENCVRLINFFPQSTGLVLVMEYMRSDLGEVLRASPRRLYEDEVKCYMQMLLRGLAHLEELGILHRDIKPANLLISEEGVLKIGDFGLARVKPGDGAEITQQVTTRWYRAPEILYGTRKYGHAIDIWAAGCVFAELLEHSPLFPGDNDIDQLYRVLSAFGTPTEESWPGLYALPDYNKITFPPMKQRGLEELVSHATPSAIALLKKLLVLDPAKRISAREALKDPYFFTHPVACPASRLPKGFRKRFEVPVLDVNAPLELNIPLQGIHPSTQLRVQEHA